MRTKRTLAAAALMLAFAAAAPLLVTGLTGCGSAEAKPLDVTYYYLPG